MEMLTKAGFRLGSAVAFLFAIGLSCITLVAYAQQPVASHELSGTEAGTILGRSVLDSDGADIGLLVDVVVDKGGTPVAGVVDVGGFLGVGIRRVAVSWHLFRFEHDNGETIINMNFNIDTAAAAPEYQGPDNTLIIVDRPPQ
jgi:hypothetical protein